MRLMKAHWPSESRAPPLPTEVVAQHGAVGEGVLRRALADGGSAVARARWDRCSSILCAEDAQSGGGPSTPQNHETGLTN